MLKMHSIIIILINNQTKTNIVGIKFKVGESERAMIHTINSRQLLNEM
jgi:hypothetical protein